MSLKNNKAGLILKEITELQTNFPLVDDSLNNTLSLDIETTPKEEYKELDKAALSFLTGDISVVGLVGYIDGVLNCFQFENTPEEFTKLKELFKSILKNNISLTGHNLKFDLGFLVHYNLLTYEEACALWKHDSSIGSAIHPHKIPDKWLEKYEFKRKIENKGRKISHRKAGPGSLKTNAPYYLGVSAFWETEDHSNSKYNLLDCLYTLYLTAYFCNNWDSRGLNRIQETYFNIIDRAKMLLKMELEGVKFDIREAERRMHENALELNKLEGEIQEQWKPHFEDWGALQLKSIELKYNEMKQRAIEKSADPERDLLKISARYDKLKETAIEKADIRFNLNSSEQLAWLLKIKLNLDITSLKDEGKESTGKDVLEALAESNSEVRKLIAYRKKQKLQTSFYPNLIQQASIDGRIHCSYNITGARTGRLSSSNPNLQQIPKDLKDLFIPEEGNVFIDLDMCFPESVEILTKKRGWVPATKIIKGDLVWAVCKDTLIGKWQRPVKIINKKYTGNMIKFKNSRMEFSCTEGHTILTSKNNYEQYSPRVSKASKDMPEVPYQFTIPTNSLNKVKNPKFDWDRTFLAADQIWAACALAADGRISKSKQKVVFHVALPRKVSALKGLFPNSEARPDRHISPGSMQAYNITTDISEFRNNPFIDLETKELKLEGLTEFDINNFISALVFWDGNNKGVGDIREFYSTNERQVDYIQAFLVRHGYSCSKILKHSYVNNTTGELKNVFILRLSKKHRGIKLIKFNKNQISATSVKNVEVGCVRVPLGFILIRSGGKTLISGNCALEPVLIAHYSEDAALTNLIKSGDSFHSYNAKAMFELPVNNLKEVAEKYPKERKAAKLSGLSILYGSGAKTLQSALTGLGFNNFSIEDCKQIVYKIRNAYKTIGEFKKAIDGLAEDGKIYYNYLGRPLVFENKDDIYLKNFNSLIQGSGSDIVMQSALDFFTKNGKTGLRFLVHDSICIEVPLNIAEEKIKELGAEMTKWKLSNGLKFETEGGIGKNWKI